MREVGLAPLHGLRAKLVAKFFLVFVVILTTLEFMHFYGLPIFGIRGDIAMRRDEALRGLTLIADLKKERLERWLEERRDDIHVSAEDRAIRATVKEVCQALAQCQGQGLAGAELWSNPRIRAGSRTLAEHLRLVMSSYGVYEAVFIVDARSGKVIASTDDAQIGTDAKKEEYYADQRSPIDDRISDVVMDPRTGTPTFYISHVIADTDAVAPAKNRAKAIAALVMQVSTDNILRPMLHTGEGLGARGEALLINRRAEILTHLKHPLADGSVAEPLTYRIGALPAARAARGEEGTIETTDYRGVPVLAAYRYVPIALDNGWGMVVKRDRDELYAALRHDMLYSLWIAAGALVLSVFFVATLARRIVRPVLNLSKAARKVAAGDLSARAAVTTTDEVGSLATVFNTMVERLHDSHDELTRQVRQRTAHLERANTDLRRLNEEVESFAFSVSHDLRTPLVSLHGMTAMLMRDHAEQLGERGLHRLQRLEANVARMDTLISDLLDLSRVGRTDPPRQEVDLAKVIGGVLASMAEELTSKAVEVSVRGCDHRVPHDRNRLTQVFSNLVGNAVKYRGDQERSRIEIVGQASEQELTVHVTDDGVGIAPEFHEKVFAAFQRLPQPEEITGTGMGLAIVKKIVAHHGGRIWIESRLDRGATFSFTIPWVTEPETESSAQGDESSG